MAHDGGGDRAPDGVSRQWKKKLVVVAVDEAGGNAACVGPEHTIGVSDDWLKHPAGCLAFSPAFLLFLFCRLVHKGRYC